MKKLGYIMMLFVLTMSAAQAAAQNDRQCIRQGNRYFRNNSFSKAETEYNKALDINPNNPQAAYNLGCAIMMQDSNDKVNKDSVAVARFLDAANMEKVPLRRAQSNHNIGVIFQSKQDYALAIEAYKEALRDNPYDDETRYNLALCQKLQKKQQQQEQSQDQNNDDKKDKEKEEKKESDNKDAQKSEDKSKMSDQNVEQLLNAAMRKEKQTQDRLNKMKQQQKSRELEKYW